MKATLLTIGTALGLAICAAPAAAAAPGSGAQFERFSYSGRSHEAAAPSAAQYRNPVLSGYYPDPSVLRVGDDYYLVNSSFTNFPGLPLFHSRDLATWSQIGNVIDRPSQFSFKGLGSSRGIYAPDISHHGNTFYLVTTCVDCGGNAVMTATNPAGPWSDPVKLAFGGIDPSLFWDSDGKAYLVGNDAPAETPRYDGHRAIWVQEFDPALLAVKGERTLLVNGGVDITTKPSWIEGPHIFRRGDYYYLIAAEGGTGDNHSEVVFRSRSVRGPFVPYDGNPILSQRKLDPKRANPVTSAGHAKFVQTQNGDWWATFLATRPYGNGLYNIGRETFLLPVTWRDDWPTVLDDGQPIPFTAARPQLPAQPTPALPLSGDFSYVDEFDGPRLAAQWIGVRTPAQPFHRLEGGRLVLEPAGKLGDLDAAPGFLARRQQHHVATVSTSLRFRPARDGDRAGLVAYQSDASHLFYGLAMEKGRRVLALYVRDKAAGERRLASVPFDGDAVDLELHADGGRMRFAWTAGGARRVLKDGVDATFLSTAKAGGFTGTIIGPYVWRAGARQASQTTGHGERQRIGFNDGWRFHLGDPDGDSAPYLYDVRPEVTQSADGKDADARPDEAVRAAGTGLPILKPWILPSGNRFIRDPARRHVRPAGSPVADAPFARLDYDDRAWSTVRLPHDWAIAGPFLETGPYGGMGRLKTWGPAWYRNTLDLTAADRGKSVFLDVDGAMAYASVWVNGQLAGGWPYGYNAFRIDLTPYLKQEARNQIAIRLDNTPESARWYPGAGLYRNVWITKAAPLHVGQWGVHITTPKVSKASADVAWRVTLDNAGATPASADVVTELYALDAQGQPSGKPVARVAAPRTIVAPGASADVAGQATVAKPRLWGPPPAQQPHRYLAVTTVRQNGRVVDRHETPFGIRTLRFDPKLGIIVNGERIPLRGVNNHHDLGALGAAFNVRAAERQLAMLQEMGANAVRMSHNPPDPQLLALTDRMGMLVMNEVFDSWQRKKTPLDFHLIFDDWHEQDLRAMIRRDRNHPSVIMWSIGNEVGEQYTDQEGALIARRLHAIAKEEDPTRPTTTAMNYAKPHMPLPAEVDVISLNYQGEGIRQDPEFEGTDRIRTPPQYPAFHAKFPDKMILTSESASAFSSRGVYYFPVHPASSSIVRDGRGGDSKRQQVSSYELYAVDFGSSADKVFAALDRHPYVAGEFVWTGFDYLGEPTPYYGARSSYTGIIDLAGFKKDRFYLYQSRWRPDLPMAHILPHWTWPERVGQVTPVHVFTSGDEAELFVNGKSQGRQKKAPFTYRLRWDAVKYEPGEVLVVAYKNGKEWARASTRTAQQASALQASADRSAIDGDGRDLSFVTVRIADAGGVTVPRTSHRVRFEVSGPGELVATDNGDPTSFESFVSPERAAFNGMVLGIVRAKPGAKGPITVRVTADGLAGASVTLQAAPAQ